MIGQLTGCGFRVWFRTRLCQNRRAVQLTVEASVLVAERWILARLRHQRLPRRRQRRLLGLAESDHLGPQIRTHSPTPRQSTFEFPIPIVNDYCFNINAL